MLFVSFPNKSLALSVLLGAFAQSLVDAYSTSYAKNDVLQAYICGDPSVSNGSPPLRTFLENDPFWFCINPKNYYKNHYKVVEITTTTCVNDAHTEQMIVNAAATSSSSTVLQPNINGADGWTGQRANSDGMGFSSVIDELWRKEDDEDIVCSGDTVIQYIGPCEDQTYGFPTTNYVGSFAHGLCVRGASQASATTNTGFSYTNVGTLQNGVQRHGDQPDTWTQINHNQVCKGGLYLQPSSIQGPSSGTNVVIDAVANNRRNGVTVCALIEEVNEEEDRSGNWEQPLLSQGFRKSSMLADNYRGYCKTIKEPCPSSYPKEYADSTFQGNIEIDTKVKLKLFF